MTADGVPSCPVCHELGRAVCDAPDCPNAVKQRPAQWANLADALHSDLMTVGSARLRACPVRGRAGQGDAQCRCLGPSCMAWRWIPIPEAVKARGATLPQLGYCGMGGIPLSYIDERVEPLLAELRVYSHFKGHETLSKA